MPARLAIALVLAALGPVLSQAAAQEQRRWIAHIDNDTAILAFGTPDSDDTAFLLHCGKRDKSASLTVFEEVADMPPGRDITITLSAGGGSTQIPAQTATDDLMEFTYGRAETVAVAAVLDILRRDGALAVAMGKTRARYPAAGRAEAVAEFAAGCGLR